MKIQNVQTVQNNLMDMIFGVVKHDVYLSATRIASDLNASLPKSVATPAVCTCLKELSFEYTVKVKITMIRYPTSIKTGSLVYKVYELNFG